MNVTIANYGLRIIMPNKNYIKGVRKERKLVNEYRDKGCIALRSAGSHSPIDVVVIDSYHKVIHLFQCKPSSMSITNKNKILSSLSSCVGNFEVTVDVV